MTCQNCGAVLEENTSFCPDCGAKVDNIQNENQSSYDAQQEYNNTYAQQGYQNQPYGGNPGYNQGYNQQYDYMNNEIIEKGKKAHTFAILGLVLGIFLGPLWGWIFGGIAMSNAKKAFELTNSSEFSSTKNLGRIAVIVSSVLFVIEMIAIIAMVFAGFAVGYASY